VSQPPWVLDGPGSPPPDADADYRAIIERLYALARGGSKFGLERMERLLRALRHPERGRRAAHVAGSNGKGSTSAFLAAVLAQRFDEVGLFTSPHLVSLTERIQFLSRQGGHPIHPTELVRAVEEVEAAARGLESLSFFEVVTAAALTAMRRRAVPAAVIEAGLGARLDATRLVEAEIALLTDLSLEHTSILGDTLTEIAREEGAVVRPGRPLVMADGPSEAMIEVDRLAETAGSPVLRLGRDFFARRRADGGVRLELAELAGPVDGIRLPLAGAHQVRNAALAAQAAVLMGIHDAAVLRRGLEAARWPGRLEPMTVDGVEVLLDGAQNAHAARALAAALAERAAGPYHVVFGVMRDKDVEAMLAALRPWAASWTFTRPSSSRARAPEQLVQSTGEGEGFDDPTAALRAACARAASDGRPVLVCGSLYLVGDLRAVILGGAV
jgi:dihydrofolate synthase/folylpolyglutamate synthase